MNTPPPGRLGLIDAAIHETLVHPQRARSAGGGFALVILAGVAAVIIVIRAADAEQWVQHTLEVREVAPEPPD
ncbi:MAG: hypothetical protein WDM84_09650 [Bauldia sp.]